MEGGREGGMKVGSGGRNNRREEGRERRDEGREE